MRFHFSFRTLHAKLVSTAISDPGSIGSTHLTGNGKNRQDLAFLPVAQATFVIKNSKQTAHYRSASLSTGSFR